MRHLNRICIAYRRRTYNRVLFVVERPRWLKTRETRYLGIATYVVHAAMWPLISGMLTNGYTVIAAEITSVYMDSKNVVGHWNHHNATRVISLHPSLRHLGQGELVNQNQPLRIKKDG
jgi:hypothetical protein